MNEVIPYRTLFYIKRGENLVQHIFINGENKVLLNAIRVFDKQLCLELDIKEISEEQLNYLIELNELDLHIPYIHLLLEEE